MVKGTVLAETQLTISSSGGKSEGFIVCDMENLMEWESRGMNRMRNPAEYFVRYDWEMIDGLMFSRGILLRFFRRSFETRWFFGSYVRTSLFS